MAEDIISVFENKVLDGFSLCGIDLESLAAEHGVIGVAVSGGADSISLLYSLCNILSRFSIPLEVITVNHYIREKSETCGDAQFVINSCAGLKKSGFNVNCTLVELKEGEVFQAARCRKAGVEEAARVLRYGSFEDFIKEKGLSFLCLAHNKNDQLETVLMRFLQGSNSDSAGGISIRRGKYIRPLLNISRDDIENYLVARKVFWRNDCTNDDTNYFRNNVRHNLIPFLNKNFAGWEKAVLSGAKKAVEDSEAISDIVDGFSLSVVLANGDGEHSNCPASGDGSATSNGSAHKVGVGASHDDWPAHKVGVGASHDDWPAHKVGVGASQVSFSLSDFNNECDAVKKRILMKACNIAGEDKRIPNLFLEDVISSFACHDENGDFSKFYDCVEISLKNNLIFVKKYVKKDTDLVFFDIIEENGVYDFPFGKLSVTFNDSGVYFFINGCQSVVDCHYPFCVRSVRQGDEIMNNDGKMKKVSDIFSDWHVVNSDKKLIPIVQSLGKDNDFNICVLGAFLGYKDWIVK